MYVGTGTVWGMEQAAHIAGSGSHLVANVS